MSANTWSPPTEFCPQCKRPVRVTITNRLWTHDRSIKLHETVVCLFGDPEELPG